MSYRLSAVVATLFLAMGAVGCASPWESSFRRNPALNGRKFPPTESAQIRAIEFERLQQYAAKEKSLRVASTTAPEDLTEEDRLAAKNRLLETLQLRERGDEVEVLGWSEFTDFDMLDAHDGRLEKFARKIGADYAIVASQYVGKVTRTIDRPMTTYSNTYYTTLRGHRGRHGGTYSVTDTSTTWVPVNVVEDQYLYTAAFVRKLRPDEVQ